MAMNGKLFPIVKATFSITYILLITTGTIIFIEALRSGTSPFISHVMNLEVAISVIASYFYSLFMTEVTRSEETNTHLNWDKITLYRYIDWSITTPIMLLVLCMFLAHNVGKVIPVFTYLTIVVLNYIMLGFGYLGAVNVTSQQTGLLGGFAAFFLMFGLIYKNFVLPKFSKSNYWLFGLYFVVWSLYGVAYLFDNEMKTIMTNILDLISKCFVGLGLWAYYTNILAT